MRQLLDALKIRIREWRSVSPPVDKQIDWIIDPFNADAMDT